jgi:hypothetical protein
MPSTRRLCAATLLVFGTATVAIAPAADPLTTVAERSAFRETGRYDEVIALCAAFANRYPDAVRCIDFGTTPEGRPMKAIVATRTGAFTPDQARARNLPVLLIQGGIHAGEIDGKDAGFLALREALDGKAAKGDLERIVWIFVPVFNVDGHERFGAWSRPNQRGPKEMGWRTTAQNFNLNRDYVKADAPEMQAMLRLIEAWDPVAYVDLHVTDGAQFQHDVSITAEPVHMGDEELRKAGTAMRDGVIERLTAQGSKPLAFYPALVGSDDPASGFAEGVPTPRYSHGYMPLRNRMGMLVETHSWKDYPTRVRITRNAIVAMLDLTAQLGGEWLKTERDADERATHLGGQSVALDYKATDAAHAIDFLGYAYTRTPSDVSGALMTRYDEHTRQVWHIPLRSDVRPIASVVAPTGGYIVPAAHAAWVAEKLRQHGVNFRTLGHAIPHAAIEAFRADKATFAASSNESHQRLTLAGSWKPGTREIGAGALFVPIAQPKARLVVELFEPQAPDALVAWGEFNNAFEQKEYMEAYVAEDVARKQLAADPALAAAFKKKLADDPAFAKDPDARLDFFYRRSPSWDERFDLYPVMRTAIVPD